MKNKKIEIKEKRCPICNKINDSRSRKTCGSPECIKQLHKLSVEKSNMEKYGVKHVLSLKSIHEKSKETKLKKYGIETYNNSQKRMETNLNTYGNTWGNIEKAKKSLVASGGIGVANPKIREKIENTNEKRYGTKNFYASDESKLRNEIKNGSRFYSNKEKAKKTKLKKYGDAFGNQEKARETIIENHDGLGMASDSLKEKILITKLEKKIHKIENFINEKDLDFEILYDKTTIENGVILRCFKCNSEFRNVLRCPICDSSSSVQEKELFDFIKSIYRGEIERNNRYALGNGQEIDIYIPELKMGFEFNGLYWHSCEQKSFNYHFEKSEIARKQKIHLIHIWEDDWYFKRNIIESRIKSMLNVNQRRIFARKCEIRNVGPKQSKWFLSKNHLQGNIPSKYVFGLFFESELVSLMTIANNGEIKRFCNLMNHQVIGGFGKLFNHAKDLIKYSFVDLDWSTEDNVYNKFMKFDSITGPSYGYIINGVRESRIKYQKHKLLKMGWGTPEQTEKEIMREKGILTWSNSGNLKYIKEDES